MTDANGLFQHHQNAESVGELWPEERGEARVRRMLSTYFQMAKPDSPLSTATAGYLRTIEVIGAATAALK